MDYQELKKEILEIAKIAEAVPEQFREKCFELLVSRLVAEPSTSSAPSSREDNGRSLDHDLAATPDRKVVAPNGAIPKHAQIRVFMAKTGVTDDDLTAVLMMDDDQAHFVREPSSGSVATGQIEWALLLALKSGIESNKLEADPEAVRSICQEKGFYDRKNFATNFKKAKYAAYFKNAMEPQGAAQGLTQEGIEALGRLIKSLASASK